MTVAEIHPLNSSPKKVSLLTRQHISISMKSTTILLTGGTGFLGSHIVKRLINECFKVIVVKRSTSNLFRLQSIAHGLILYDLDCVDFDRIFQENIIDVIVHCATNYGRSSVPPTEIIQANLLLPLELLQRAKNYRVKSFINTDTSLNKKINNYSLSKKQFSEWLTSFSHEITCINIALEHFYGAFDDHSKFVSRIILDLLNNVDCIELTLGEQKRDFIYIDDVVDAFMKLIRLSIDIPNGLYYYEIGTAQTIEIREFVKLISKLIGNENTQLKFGAIPYRKNEIMESCADISMLSKLGWHPQVSLIEGIQYTIDRERSYLNL